MKNLLVLASACIGVVVLSCLSSLGIYMWDPMGYHEKEDIGAQIEQVHNPLITDVNEVLSLQQRMSCDMYYDSVFVSIPRETLENISKVLIGNHGDVTIMEICSEFRDKYKDFYKHIAPEKDTPPDPGNISTNTASDSTTTNKGDTVIINGVLYKRE